MANTDQATQTAVNQWFAENPNATPQQVASTVQSIGGLTPQLAGALANYYGTDVNQIQAGFNQLTTLGNSPPQVSLPPVQTGGLLTPPPARVTGGPVRVEQAIPSTLQNNVNQWFDKNPNATPQQIVDAIKASGGLTPEFSQAIANKMGSTAADVQNAYTALNPPPSPAPTAAKVNPVTALQDFVNTTNDPSQIANKIKELGGLSPDLTNVMVQKFGSNPTSVQTAYNELTTPGSLNRNAWFMTHPNPRGFVIGDPAGFDISQVASIALMVAFPGAAAALGTELGVSEIVGKAIINAAISVASGNSIETALQNATIDAITQTGSQSVAKDIANAVGKVGADAIAGAGGSIVATLTKGGSAEDALKNATGSIVNAAVKGEFGSTAGSAAGGYVTGGLTGAVMGGATSLLGGGSKTPGQEVVINDMTAGVDVAGPGGFQELKQGQLNILPTGTYFGNVPVVIDSKTGQIISATGSTQDIETLRAGNVSTLRVDTSKIDPVFLDKSPLNPNLSQEELNALKNVAKADAAKNALKTGKFDEYFNTYGAGTAGDPVFQQMLEQELAKDPTYAPYLETYKNLTGKDYVPSATSSGTAPVTDYGTIEIVGSKDKTVSPTTSPIYSGSTKSAATGATSTTASKTAIPTGSTSTTTSTTPSTTTDPMTTFYSSGGDGPAGVGPSGTDSTGASGPIVVTPKDKVITAVTPKDKVITKVDSSSSGPVIVPGVTAPDTKTKIDETLITTDPKIYSGVSPKSSTSTLYPTLSGFGSSPLQQSLAAYTPPGDVEGEATGKPRQNVWNEASLRLKDALGI